MASDTCLDVLTKGKKAWNIWYRARNRGPVDLKEINLACADLSGFNFAGALLEMADLRYSDLTEADLSGANLSGAKMTRTILVGANLRRAKGLTPEQLHYADGDETTRLPEGLRPPDHWRNTGEEILHLQESESVSEPSPDRSGRAGQDSGITDAGEPDRLTPRTYRSASNRPGNLAEEPGTRQSAGLQSA